MLRETMPLFDKCLGQMLANTPLGATKEAGEIPASLVFLTTLVVALAGLAIVVFPALFRRRADKSTAGAPTSSRAFYVIVALGASLLGGAVFCSGFHRWIASRVPPGEALNIRVRANRKAWSFDYPRLNIVSAKQLVFAKNQPVKLLMRSDDVTHGFYVPSLGLRRDLTPDRYSVLWANVPVAGEHPIFCTKYCGGSHGAANRTIKVVESADFDKWVAMGGDPDSTPEKIGERLFVSKGCATCHSTTRDKKGLVCPPLGAAFGTMETLSDGSQVRFDEEFIRESILSPRAKISKGYEPVMPEFAGQFTDKQLEGLILYIKSLK